MIRVLLTLLIPLIFSNLIRKDNQKEGKTMNEIYNYTILKAGDIKPEGWIKEQLKRDLTEGYIGVFNKVHPTVNNDVFLHQDRLSKRKYSLRKEWWSGEHEGYWKDAIVRMAYLTGNDTFKTRAQNWMKDILEHQGEDGYIGIYKDCEKPNCVLII